MFSMFSMGQLPGWGIPASAPAWACQTPVLLLSLSPRQALEVTGETLQMSPSEGQGGLISSLSNSVFISISPRVHPALFFISPRAHPALFCISPRCSCPALCLQECDPPPVLGHPTAEMVAFNWKVRLVHIPRAGIAALSMWGVLGGF